MKVAIIDDDMSVQKALGRLLSVEGIETQPFASGGTFLRTFSAAPPDCLILDLQMPGMSGLEVQKALLDAHVATPVIVVTSTDDVNLVKRALDAGAVACLTKPVDDGMLLDLVRDVLVRKGQSPAAS